MSLKGLMPNLSFVKENRSWLIMWAVTLAAGTLLFTAWLHSPQIMVHPFLPVVTSEQWWCFTSVSLLPQQLTVSSTLFSYLLKIMHHLKPFPVCDFDSCCIQKSMTEQINLGDELLFLQHYHEFEEILKRTDLFLWFIDLLKLGIFCNRMYIVWTVEIFKMSNV